MNTPWWTPAMNLLSFLPRLLHRKLTPPRRLRLDWLEARHLPSSGITNVAVTAPVQITTGPGGNLWATSSSGTTNFIDQISPQGTLLQQFQVPTASANVTGIANGPDGNIWFTEATASGKIGRVTP